MKLSRANALRGELSVPGDKSISHRSVMFGALADGLTEIRGFLNGADCLATISCFSRMGIRIEQNADAVLVHGNGLRGLAQPQDTLDCQNSGTSLRLISGILAAQPFESVLTGDESIRRRPMGRIIDPLTLMGARMESIPGNGCAPLRIHGSRLHGIRYVSPVASAQVKSAILLAGLYAEGETRVIEPYLSRNHTELMLSAFGADVQSEHNTAIIRPAARLEGQKIQVPGDISSAAFFLAAASILPGSEILIHNVGINPTRDGILQICRRMGGNVTLLNERQNAGEPVADLLVRPAPLHGTEIGGAVIPTLIDELPVIAVMACFAEGTTVIRDAAELKVKESNRIASVVQNLSAMGADITETDDGMIIRGGRPLHGAVIESHRDHRIAMAFAIAALAADGETEIPDDGCVAISYPTFFADLQKLFR